MREMKRLTSNVGLESGMTGGHCNVNIPFAMPYYVRTSSKKLISSWWDKLRVCGRFEFCEIFEFEFIGRADYTNGGPKFWCTCYIWVSKFDVRLARRRVEWPARIHVMLMLCVTVHC